MRRSALSRRALLAVGVTCMLANAGGRTMAWQRVGRGRPVHLPACALAPDRTTSMFVPLGALPLFGSADIMLNNRGVAVRTIAPTWYVHGRGAVVGRAIELPPHQAGFFTLTDFLPDGVR